MTNLYQLFCEHCGWKKITQGSDVDLVQVPSAPVPRGIPHIDPVTNEMITPKPMKVKKKYKCPQCGYIVISKAIKNPQENVEQKMDLEKRIRRRLENDEKERMRQIERQRKKQNWANGSKTSPE